MSYVANNDSKLNVFVFNQILDFCKIKTCLSPYTLQLRHFFFFQISSKSQTCPPPTPLFPWSQGFFSSFTNCYCSCCAPFSWFPLTLIPLPHWTQSSLSESTRQSLHCFSHFLQLPISTEKARPLGMHRLQDLILHHLLLFLLSSPTLDHPVFQRS